MSLVKRTYVDQVTVITAENLNAIQDAIIANEGAIEEQGEAIEGKYTKPAGGVPASDMASGVQTSLGKADSAYQKPSGGIPATDLASAVQTSLGKADTAYQKPSGGIPSTDLASAVQTSLGKADTALQSSDIDSTLTVTGKAADAKKTGDEISDVKNTLNSLDSSLTTKILKATSAVTPQTTQQTYTLTGLTSDHELIRWNFKNSGTDAAENSPPCDLTWSTGTDQWTLVGSSATTYTCQPVFAIPE